MVLVIWSSRSLLAIEHSPGHRLHNLRHRRSELWLGLYQQKFVGELPIGQVIALTGT
nr:unnamed protein product [Digitaria exilis]